MYIRTSVLKNLDETNPLTITHVLKIIYMLYK